MLCATLVGCSSTVGPHDPVTVTWENGVIKYGSTTLSVDSWNGRQAVATTATGSTVTMQMEEVKDLGWLEWNTQGIEEMSMNDYKKAKWYSEYLDTKITVAYPIIAGECYAAGWAAVTGNVNADVAVVYDMLSSIPWTDGGITVDFGEFTLSEPYSEVNVRPDAVVVTGIVKVSQGANDKCTNPYIVTGSKGEYTLYMYSDSKYSYYSYNGFLIQMGLGLSLEDYIHFK